MSGYSGKVIAKREIINEAAEHVGGSPIASLDDARTGVTEILFLRYDQAVKEVLEEPVDWHGAIKRVKLAASPVDGDLYPDLFSYILPPGFVRLVWSSCESDPDRFMEGGRLYTRVKAPLLLIYISFETDTHWGANLIRLMGLSLARKCLYGRKESASQLQRVEQAYALQLRKAAQIEGQFRGPSFLENEGF
jgi:hypothetical protein